MVVHKSESEKPKKEAKDLEKRLETERAHAKLLNAETHRLRIEGNRQTLENQLPAPAQAPMRQRQGQGSQGRRQQKTTAIGDFSVSIRPHSTPTSGIYFEVITLKSLIIALHNTLIS